MATLEASTAAAFCHACGSQIDSRAEICPKCGVRQRKPAPQTGRNRITAALFALLLGGLGAHKFYLGSPGLGVLYLLFCWTFVPAIVGLIEGIVLLSMSDQDFAAKYP
jgi:TM2 domain-containing membrane protein YozV